MPLNHVFKQLSGNHFGNPTKGDFDKFNTGLSAVCLSDGLFFFRRFIFSGD